MLGKKPSIKASGETKHLEMSAKVVLGEITARQLTDKTGDKYSAGDVVDLGVLASTEAFTPNDTAVALFNESEAR